MLVPERSISELCDFGLPSVWHFWLGPVCAPLVQARKSQGRLDKQTREKLEELLIPSRCDELANRYQACLEQSISLLHGLVHGLLAAAAYRAWTDQIEPGTHGALREGHDTSPSQVKQAFLQHALSCATAYQEAWPLNDAFWPTATNQYQTKRKSSELETALEDLQPTSGGITVSGMLILRRLLAYLLGHPDTEPWSATPARLLLYNELLKKGQVELLTIRASEEGAFGFYLDPVWLGLTVIDADMLSSLQTAWQLCRDALLSNGDANARALSIRVSPFEHYYEECQGERQKAAAGHDDERLYRTPVAVLSGGSAGVVTACGMYTVANAKDKSDRLNTNVTATAALASEAGVLMPVSFDPDSIKAKLEAAHANSLRVVMQRTQREWAINENLVPKGLAVLSADTLDEAITHFTGDVRVERALTAYSREQIEDWDQRWTCPWSADDANTEKCLLYYVPPHYALLKGRDAEGEKYERVPGDTEEAVLENLLDEGLSPSGQRLCVFEGPGVGKTTFSRRVRAFVSARGIKAHKPVLAVRWEDHSPEMVPGWPLNFMAALEEEIAPFYEPEPGLRSQDVVRWALKHERLVLILDALDQTGDTQMQALWDFLATIEMQKWKCRVILTGRSAGVEKLRREKLSGFQLSRIEPFDAVQQYRYLYGPEPPARPTGDPWLDRSLPPEIVRLIEPANADDHAVNEYSWQPACAQVLRRSFENYDQVAAELGNPDVLRMVREKATANASHQLPRFASRAELHLQISDYVLDRAARKILGQSPPEWLVRRLQLILGAVACQMMLKDPHVHRVEKNVAAYKNGASHRLADPVAVGKTFEIDRAEYRDEWDFVLQVTDLRNELLTGGGGRVLAWPNRRKMEFYCGLHLARNTQANWCDPTAIGGAAPELRPWVADPAWREAFMYAIELPIVEEDTYEAARIKRNLLASLSCLFEARVGEPRPTELMYKVWHLFEIDELILRQFRWQDDAGQPLKRGALLARGRKLLLPGCESVMEEFRRPLKQLLENHNERGFSDVELRQRNVAKELMESFVRCPPHNSSRKAHTFWMGSSANDGFDNERPRHKVRVPAFKLMKTVVTNEQFALFDVTRERRLRRDYLTKTDRRFPASCGTWYDAFAFSKWLGPEYCLPTETQWEFACRAGKDGPTDHFHFGPLLCSSQANFSPSDDRYSYEESMPHYRNGCVSVDARFPANGWGLRQMHGNVWEWCWDWYDPEWYRRRTQGLKLSDSIEGDSGPSYSGMGRVRRGGGTGSAYQCRSANRDYGDPFQVFFDIGFRVCCLVA